MTTAADRSFARRVGVAFAYSAAGNVVSKVVSVVALLIAIKRVTPEEFGMASIVMAVFAILRALSELSLGVSLVQAAEPTRRQIDSLFWFSLIISAGIYAVIFVAGAPLIGWFYDESQLVSLLRVQSLTVVLYAIAFVSRAMLERELAFGRLTLIDNAALLASSGLMIWLAIAGYGVWAFILGEVGFRLGQALLCQLAYPYLPRLVFAPREVLGMVRFGLYAAGSRLLYNFYINIDYLIVGKLFSGEELGLYTFAYRVVSDPVKALASVVNQVAYPAFARLQNDRERLRRYYATIARLSVALIGLLLVVVVVFLEPVLEALGYQQWIGAVPLMYVFAAVGLLQAVAPLTPQLLNAVGQPRLNFIYSAVCAVVMPAVFLVGAQVSLTGVAVAWVVGYSVVVTVLFRFGAGALGWSLPIMLARSFAALRILAPLAAAASGGRVLFEALAVPALPLAVVGAAVTLAVGLGSVYLRERGNLAWARKPSGS